MSNQDLLLKQLHDLHGYIRLLGEHINQIHSRLDQLERNISEMKSTHTASIEINKTGLEDIKKIIASKAEVNGLFQELNNSLRGSLPTLPERVVEEPEVEEPEVEEAYQEEKREQEKSKEEDRRRRFPFLRRF
jgi:chromosome segregation ATPase